MSARHRSAFTILELTLVVMILGILTASAVPRYFDAIASYRAEAAVKRVIADLKLAQRYAKQTSTPHSVAFSTSLNGYTFLAMADIDRRGTNYSLDFDREGYGVKMVGADFNSTQTVTFDIYGIPDSFGTINLQSSHVAYAISIDEEGVITTLRSVF